MSAAALNNIKEERGLEGQGGVQPNTVFISEKAPVRVQADHQSKIDSLDVEAGDQHMAVARENFSLAQENPGNSREDKMLKIQASYSAEAKKADDQHVSVARENFTLAQENPGNSRENRKLKIQASYSADAKPAPKEEEELSADQNKPEERITITEDTQRVAVPVEANLLSSQETLVGEEQDGDVMVQGPLHPERLNIRRTEMLVNVPQERVIVPTKLSDLDLDALETLNITNSERLVRKRLVARAEEEDSWFNLDIRRTLKRVDQMDGGDQLAQTDINQEDITITDPSAGDKKVASVKRITAETKGLDGGNEVIRDTYELMRVCQEGLEGQEEDEQEVTQGEKDLLAAHSLAMVTLGRQSQDDAEPESRAMFAKHQDSAEDKGPIEPGRSRSMAVLADKPKVRTLRDTFHTKAMVHLH